jgi:hypothetical protein
MQQIAVMTPAKVARYGGQFVAATVANRLARAHAKMLL